MPEFNRETFDNVNKVNYSKDGIKSIINGFNYLEVNTQLLSDSVNELAVSHYNKLLYCVRKQNKINNAETKIKENKIKSKKTTKYKSSKNFYKSCLVSR